MSSDAPADAAALRDAARLLERLHDRLSAALGQLQGDGTVLARSEPSAVAVAVQDVLDDLADARELLDAVRFGGPDLTSGGTLPIL